MKTNKNIFPKIDTLLPNQQINFAINLLKQLNKESGGLSDLYDYDTESELKGWLEIALRDKETIKKLTKKSILNVIEMQRKLRFLPEHRFYMLFDFN